MQKQHLIVIFFYSFLTWLGINAVKGINLPRPFSTNQSEEEAGIKKSLSFLQGVDYFLYRDGEQQLYLNASELTYGPTLGEVSGEMVNFLMPKGHVVAPAQDEFFFSGLKGQYQSELGLLKLQEQVVIKRGQDRLAADQIHYQYRDGSLQAMGQVKTTSFLPDSKNVVRISAEKLSASVQKNTGTYSGNVHGVIDRHYKYETDVFFTAQQLFLDLFSTWAQLTGEVEIKQNNVVAQAKRGELFLDNYNKKLKYYVLYDDVKVKEKLFLTNQGAIERKAFSEQLEGIIGEEKLVLKGFPRVIQGQDTVKGNLIVLRQNNEIVEVDDAHTNWVIKAD